jgi:serine/threonine-protein kinase RsbW
MHSSGGEASDHQVRVLDGGSLCELTFTLGDLSTVRRVVEKAAAGAGLSAARVGEMVLAVNEVATNAVTHGRPPARLRIWEGNDELVFEVSDAGDGIADALAGETRPATGAPSGRGLWLTGLLADSVEVRSGDGCTVSVHAAAPA